MRKSPHVKDLILCDKMFHTIWQERTMKVFKVQSSIIPLAHILTRGNTTTNSSLLQLESTNVVYENETIAPALVDKYRVDINGSETGSSVSIGDPSQSNPD